ncbi:hypothetical protein [Labedaea rhizosphaerae]|uniref:Uncharacterized protein n=1 Tax=Labedaea rhizosphaerae TaxID=598644 RepID=A0A4R6SDB9_LABRH|nr:hypothetical protein [Labedaea rhizosphaerae]TDP97647.1 hypothetical protein EV186_103611 [Labedaea rhizosphaerae]
MSDLFVTVRFDDDPENPIESVVSSRDIYKWEKSGRGRSMSNLGSGNLRMSDVYELTHIALGRRKLWSGSLEDLVDGADIDVKDTSDLDPDDERHENEDPTSAGA